MIKTMITSIVFFILTSGSVYPSGEYEESIQTVEARLEYHRKVLKDYENKSYVYGRFGMDIQSHTKANIRYYEELLEEYRKESSK